MYRLQKLGYPVRAWEHQPSMIEGLALVPTN